MSTHTFNSKLVFNISNGVEGTQHITVFNSGIRNHSEKVTFDILSHKYLRLHMKWLSTVSTPKLVHPDTKLPIPLGKIALRGIPVSSFTVDDILRIKGLINTEGSSKLRGHWTNEQWVKVLDNELKLRNEKCNTLAKKVLEVCSTLKKKEPYELLAKNTDIFIQK